MILDRLGRFFTWTLLCPLLDLQGGEIFSMSIECLPGSVFGGGGFHALHTRVPVGLMGSKKHPLPLLSPLYDGLEFDVPLPSSVILFGPTLPKGSPSQGIRSSACVAG